MAQNAFLWSPAITLSTASHTAPAALKAASKLQWDTAVSGSICAIAFGWSGSELQILLIFSRYEYSWHCVESNHKKI